MYIIRKARNGGSVISAYDAIKALAEHWDETVPYLGQDDLRLIAESVRSIEPEPADPEGIEDAIAHVIRVLAARLPRGHPVRAAMSGGTRLTVAPPELARTTAMLRALPDLHTELLTGERASDSAATPSRSGGEPDIEAWLLAAPAVAEQQLRDQGGDPDRNDLIKLVPQTGPMRLPSFQFGVAGQPIPVVATINRLLGADTDPQGVADWWLGTNAWLNAIPAELIGKVKDELLVLAARAELAEA